MKDLMEFLGLITLLPVFLWTWCAQDCEDFDGPGPRKPERKQNPSESEVKEKSEPMARPSVLREKETEKERQVFGVFLLKLGSLLTDVMRRCVDAGRVTSIGGKVEIDIANCLGDLPHGISDEDLEKAVGNIFVTNGWKVAGFVRQDYSITMEIVPTAE